MSVPSALAWAHPLVQEWFVRNFGTPTEPQEQGWPHILAGRTTLISAPTGSGKTLAAFLACIDRLVRKALAGDLHGSHRSALCLAAEGAGQRHSEKSRRAAGRDPADGGRARAADAGDPHGRPHRRHADA